MEWGLEGFDPPVGAGIIAFVVDKNFRSHIRVSRRVTPVRHYARRGAASASLEAHPHMTDTGFVVADRTAVVVDAHPHDEQALRGCRWSDLATTIPMGRVGEPLEVANVIVSLLSDEWSYVTGQCINVNGGQFML